MRAANAITAVIIDGTAVFAGRTAAAIHSYSPCKIERNFIQGCLEPAIHISADSGAVPAGNANGAHIWKNYIITARNLGERIP